MKQQSGGSPTESPKWRAMRRKGILVCLVGSLDSGAAAGRDGETIAGEGVEASSYERAPVSGIAVTAGSGQGKRSKPGQMRLCGQRSRYGYRIPDKEGGI